MPNRFDENVFSTISDFNKLGDVQNLVLDFRRVGYVFPFPTIIIAIAVKELVEKRVQKNLQTAALGLHINYGAISYLKYFGFFRLIGLPIGNNPNQAIGSNRYLPITIISRKEIDADSAGREFQYGIERQSDRLSKIIFSDEKNSGSAMMLSFCFREIIRNSFEHADVSECIVMAQRWYDGTAEITIADRGIGIFSSLSKKHNISSVEDSLHLALNPGITSSDYLATGSEWDNSGFGLYIISELGRRFGDFSVLSSEKLLMEAKGIQKLLDVSITGTVVKLKINTTDGDYFPNILNQIVRQGEKIAKNTDKAIKSASKKSKLI